MQKLKSSNQKRALWLFSKVVSAGGKMTITDPVLPSLEITTDFDLARTNEEQPVVELTIEETGACGWKMRLLLVKVIGNPIPEIYPQMYRDGDYGLRHVLSWIQGTKGEEPNLLKPSQPDYDMVCSIVNAKIDDAWRRRRSQLPVLKDEHA